MRSRLEISVRVINLARPKLVILAFVLTFTVFWNIVCQVDAGAATVLLTRILTALPLKVPFPAHTIWILCSVCGHHVCFCLKCLHLEIQLAKAKQKNPLAFWELNPQKMLFAMCWKHKVPTAGTGLVPGNFTSEKGGLSSPGGLALAQQLLSEFDYAHLALEDLP